MAMCLRTHEPRRLARRLSLTLALLAPVLAQATCQGMALHAHRGTPDAPENAQSAIVRAFDGPWDGAEIDIQQLADGHWVLHHDLQVGRTTTLSGRRVQDLSSAAWKEVLLKDRAGRVTREPAPFLSAVLDKLRDDDRDKVLNVELKQSNSRCDAAQQAVATLHRGLPDGNWFLTAIERRQLQCARQVDPAGYLGLIVLDPQALARQNPATRNSASRLQPPVLDDAWLRRLQQEIGKPVGVHVDINTLAANPRLLPLARDLGIPVFTYHLGADAEHARALREARRTTGLLPSGAIIDGQPAAFCDWVAAP